VKKITFDEDYKRARAIARQEQAKNLGEGLVFGARDFGIGIYKGVTGIVLEPIKGAKGEGAVGFFKGVGKGLAGVVLKPTIGAIDMVTRTTEGIKNTAMSRDKIRVRPPRYFGDDKKLHIYNIDKSFGQEILKTMLDGKYRNETYQFHFILEDKTMIIVTTTYLLYCLKTVELGKKWGVKWYSKLNDVFDLEVIENISIGITYYDRRKKNQKKKIITCYDEAKTDTLRKKLLQSIKAMPNSKFNKQREILSELNYYDTEEEILEQLEGERKKENKKDKKALLDQLEELREDQPLLEKEEQKSGCNCCIIV